MEFCDAVDRPAVIKKYGINDRDTGSPEVQVALLTQQVTYLAKHFERHPNDLHSQRGLMRAVSRRKKLLEYLRHEDVNRYRTLITGLGLRK